MITGLQESANPFTNAKFIGANVDPEVYHRQDEKTPRGHPEFVMSRSELMLFASCPSRWIHGYAPKETDATAWGSLFDCLVTGAPGYFDSKYVVHPRTVTATKSMTCVREGEVEAGAPVTWRKCGEATEWKQIHAKGRTVLSPDDFDEAEGARRRLMEDPVLSHFITCSAKQVMVTAEFRDEESGLVIPWKSLIDLVPRAEDETFGVYLGDLKTARSADPGKWEREIDNRNYDAQAAANLDSYTAATGERRESFVHVIVENEFPFEPTGAYLSMQFVELGRLKIVRALRFYCECVKLKFFPSWRDFTSREVYGGFIACDADQWHSQLKAR